MKRFILAIPGLLMAGLLQAQNYQALHGSPYSGSLSNDFNPAAILNSPYTWDLTLFGAQIKTMTNSFRVTNASLISSADTLTIDTKSGNYPRYVLASADLHLFNARISLDRHQAFAFGLNLRNYARIRSSKYNFTDTTSQLPNFFSINEGNVPLEVNGVQASWLEGFITYSRVIFEDDGARLQLGATLSVMRSLSGVYAYGTQFNYVPNAAGTGYIVNNVEAQYGYSQNYDRYSSGQSPLRLLKTAIRTGNPGASFDIGGEYVQKTGEDFDRQEKSGTDVYDWKLGFAFLDVGFSGYHYGMQSAAFSGVKGVVTDSSLSASFYNINSLTQFNDTVKTMVASFKSVHGTFNIATPARFMVNFDKRLDGYWAVNGELSLNLTTISSTTASVQELNFLTVTPRWEKSELGAYLPISITNQGQFWVGAAAKVGPLLIGLHNLGWLLTKKSFPNGGGYLAIIIHPGEHEKDGVPCPKY